VPMVPTGEHRTARGRAGCFLAGLICFAPHFGGWPAVPAWSAELRGQAPENVGFVELETEGSSSGSVRIAEDLANIVDGATRRVLPIVGKSAEQNLDDLTHLHAIDLAILPADILSAAQQQMYGFRTSTATSYVTLLYNQELHILALPKFKSITDLDDQEVNVDVSGSGTEMVARWLFDHLRLTAVLTNYDQILALDKLRKGEIAAVAFVAGRPAPLFQAIGRNENLHFLAIPYDTDVIGTYLPAKLDAGDYPNLIEPGKHVDTIAASTVLAANNLPPSSMRYAKVASFIDAFFTNFPSLLKPGHHPKWHEVNLAAVLPGWTRFPAAQDWLDRHSVARPKTKPEELKDQFFHFLETRQQSVRSPAMTERQMQDLLKQLERGRADEAR
jgi:uncharacterized protein